MNNFEAHPRDVEESTLYSILEADVQEKYYLSPTACQGVLRRAENRGKELPALLRVALMIQAKTNLEFMMPEETVTV